MAEPQEGEPPEFGWGLGQSVHVADKKNKEAVWAKGKVVGTEGTSRVNVRLDDGGGMVSVDMRKVKTLFTVNPKTGYDDMTSLYYLHEPGVSDNLGVRYVEDKIYTYVGRVLVVCNPFHRLEMPNPADYTGKRLDANPPHNYAIADAAYSALKKSGGTESQSVIISGESGAGKTESSKIVMRYITSVANPMEGEEDLPDRILNANPALEAFGNGTTTRNWNSSRFGKFTQLQFEGADLGGASIQTYLLEKSRVVFQGPKERNFHVFYHVFEESTLDKSAWQLGPKESYHYINQSGTFGASNVDDKSGENGVDAVIKSLQQATDGDDAYVQDVYTIIAAILWLGNVEFTGGEGATVKDPKPLEHAASLLGCTPEQLEFALTHSTKEIMGEKISANLKPADAVGSRDALARNMYGRVFDDVVSRWNTCLQLEDSEDAPAVGVLDIFGFESFEVNSFEQFCINFTNEKLQATFNQHIFKEEIHTYFEEQIQWQGITFPDNADALSVIGGKGVGVFDQLDGICKQRSAKDAQFCDMLHNQWDGKKNPAWPRTDPRKIKNHFTVKHYAGPVVYCTDNWVIKNKDTISPDITDLCRNQCGQDLVKELWASGRFGTLTTTTATGQKIHKQFMGLGKAFMKSINALTVQIDSTHVHFIRTLKTNAAMKPGYYQPDYVIAQLRDQGLLALCDLLKAGYPTRIGYGELQERFAVKMPAEINNMGLDPRSYVSALVWAYGLPKANYQCGLTKIFFRAGKVAMLDDLDNIQPAEHEHLVERVKRWVVRRRWRMGTAKAIAQVRAMQLYRSVHAMHLWSKGAGLMLVYIRTLRNIYHRIKGKVAARSVARVCRMWPVRKEYLKKTVETRKKKAAVVIESVCRAHIARKAYEEKVAAKKEAQAATMLEALCRMMLTQKATHELFGARREEKAAKVLQAAARMYAERKAFLHTKSVGTEAATKVQRLYRLLSGESGVEFKSICKQMLHMRSSFFARMDAMAEKYSSPESQPMGTRKMFKGGGGGGPGFEMWISIKLVSPHAEESDGPIKDKWGQTQLHDEVFASTSMKMRRVPGVLGAFFKDPANAALADADGNYVWHRDPTYFAYIMDFIRDGRVAWPSDAEQLELLLDECDFFELGNMVLPIIEELKKVKFAQKSQ